MMMMFWVTLGGDGSLGFASGNNQPPRVTQDVMAPSLPGPMLHWYDVTGEATVMTFVTVGQLLNFLIFFSDL
jgi:hypothetical protein